MRRIHDRRRLAPGAGALLGGLACLAGLTAPAAAPAAVDWAEAGRASVEMLRRYIRLDTTNPPARVSEAAGFLREFLAAEGIEVRLHESAPGRVILLARLPATRPDPAGARPLILLHHMDVVPADRSRWERDPFSGDLEGGYVHGRGAMDMKAHGVLHARALALLKRTGAPRSRDVILLATPDEETGGEHGVRWMIARHWDAMDPEYVLDEGGFGSRDLFSGAGRLVHGVSVVEKRVLWLRLSAAGTAAHGSQPLPDNAVEKVAAAVLRILRWRDARPPAPPPAVLLDLARGAGGLAANKFTRAIQADTISLTTLRAGVGDPPKVNVIPSAAEAALDCRLLPETDPDAFLAALREEAGPEVQVDVIYLSEAARASRTDTPLFRAMERVLRRESPDAVVAPIMIPYGTDSNAFRARGATAYGFLPVVVDAATVGSMHGDAERIPAAEVGAGLRRLYEILAEFLAPAP